MMKQTGKYLYFANAGHSILNFARKKWNLCYPNLVMNIINRGQDRDATLVPLDVLAKGIGI